MIFQHQENSSESIQPRRPSASVGRRITAFSMDFILLTFVSILIMFYLPRIIGNETAEEFKRLSGILGQTFEQEEPNKEQVQSIMLEFSQFYAKIHYEFIVTLVFITYFLVGEILFQGKTIGKSTLCIMTCSFRENSPLSMTQAFLRASLKGLSCSFALFGLINFVFFLFNRNKRSLHDLITGSTCIMTNTPYSEVSNK